MNEETATLGGGCFWCTEAVFRRLKGVRTVTPGYTGGHVKNPSYQEVCSGTTGHAEAVQIKYDPEQIPYETILTIFFHTHNPTTLNQQGNDRGTQYRSAIFYHNPRQQKSAEKIKADLDRSGEFPGPIVTEITRFTEFYEAEDYHRNYFDRNLNAPYCTYVITPKIKKLLSHFAENVSNEYK